MLPLPRDTNTLVTASLRRPTLFFCFSIYCYLEVFDVCLEFKLLWLLCRMRMLRPGINKQFLVHLATKTILGKHSFDSSFKKNFRATLLEITGNLFSTSARIPCIAIVNFLVHFVSG